jgi:hypothetical protein
LKNENEKLKSENAHLQAHSIVSIESILTKIEGEKE